MEACVIDRTKHLLFLSVSVTAMSVLLTGCYEDENNEYNSAASCKANQPDCTEVYNPILMTQKNAPRFKSVQECEDKFGPGNCVVPNDGKIARIFDTQDSCEIVYGADNCIIQKYRIAEVDNLGVERTEGWVYRPPGLMQNESGSANSSIPLSSSGSRPATIIWYPLFYQNTYFYPHTYGYWGGSPSYMTPPPRVGGSYFMNTNRATTTLGTTSAFSGQVSSVAKAGPAASASRAGTISSSSASASKAGGFGGTGSSGSGGGS